MLPQKAARLFGFFSVFLGFIFLLPSPAGAASLNALPLTANPGDFVRVEGNYFVLGGQKWFPNGINYFPLNSIQIPATQRPSPDHWFTLGIYNPSAIEEDLALIRRLGMNMIAVGLPTSSENWANFVDFLDRSKRHEPKIFLFLR